MSACKKDNNKERAPEITQIRAISPDPNDSVLSMAGPGQTIVIQGNYLSSAMEVYFNGYPAPFNSAIITETDLVITVPGDMPFALLDPAKLNTIRVITRYGEITYSFPIVPPPPSVEWVSSEFALTGDRVTINGLYFFFIDKVTFPGNIEVTTDIVTNDAGTMLEVTVPPGVTKGPISVTGVFGTGTSYFSFRDDNTSDVISNFDNSLSALNNWANATITDDAVAYPNNTGKYARFKFENIGSGNGVWWEGGRSLNFEVSSFEWVPVANLNDPPANWAVKFEVNTKIPWKGGVLIVDKDYGWNFQGRYAPWSTAAGGEYVSNGWKTAVIPLSNFRKDLGSGAGITSLGELVGGSGTGAMNIYFVNNHSGATAIDAVDIAIDNIRVVRLR